MSLTKDFVANVVSNRLVFTEQDYINFMNSSKSKIDMTEFKMLKNELGQYGYKISTSFFGKEFIHPKEINPYRTTYNLSNIINELKLRYEKTNASDKLNKLINYIELAK